MAKLASAAEFKALLDSGKYESKTNAQRAAGRTRLSDGEKKKAFAYIDAHFGADGSPPPAASPKKVSKKVSKKASKKVAAKKVAAKAAPSTPPPAPAPAPAPAAEAAPPATPKASKRVAKKASKKAAKKKVAARAPRAEASPPPGSLPISPKEVETAGDMLLLIDSTVSKGVSIIDALKRADELSKHGDISEGVAMVKSAFIGAAQLLQKTVVAPLHQTVPQTADVEVTARLAQVVQASNDPFTQTAAELPPPQTEYSTMPVMPPPPPPGTPLS